MSILVKMVGMWLVCQPPILWTQQQTPEIEAAKAQIIAAEQAVIGNQLRWQAIQQQVQLNNALQAQQMELQRQKELRMAARAALPYRSPTVIPPMPKPVGDLPSIRKPWEGKYPPDLTVEEKLAYLEGLYKVVRDDNYRLDKFSSELLKTFFRRREEAVELLNEGAEKEEIIEVLYRK